MAMQTHEALQTDRNRRIGEFYLRRTLSDDGDPLLHRPFSLRKLQAGLLLENNRLVTGNLSDEIIKQLEFDQLEWHRIRRHTDSLPIVLVGFPQGKLVDSIEDAMGTIEVARRASTMEPNEFEIMHVRIAGVDRKSQRVVAVTYSPSHNDKTIMTVSADPQELFAALEGSLDSPDFISRDLLYSDNPYANAGLITDAMMQQVQTTRGQNHTGGFLVTSDFVSYKKENVYAGSFPREGKDSIAMEVARNNGFSGSMLPTIFNGDVQVVSFTSKITGETLMLPRELQIR